MYNGIGITTPRGTGTNGYVQRNLSFVPTKRERVEYVKDADIKKLETLIEKKGNAEILEHEKKRRIEVKCMEMRDMMLNNGYDEEVTNQKVQKFRKMLLEREDLYDKTEIEYDEFGRPVSKETHQLAQANDEKNRKLREAFGIGEYDKKKNAERKAEEAREAERRKAELVNKQYTIVQEEEEEEEEAVVEEKEPPKIDKEKKKNKEDRHRHKSRDEKKRKTSPEVTKERSSHKHSKKHRHEHSDDEEESRHSRRRERSS
jgi:serine/arginine repetitive matrix protein 2